MQNNQYKKHLGGFWPIFIVVIVSMIAGGVVYAFAAGNMVQDEVDSIFFQAHSNSAKISEKTPAKPSVKIQTTVKK